MKHKKEPKLFKVRVKNGGDTYYTYSHWETRDIDGVEFVAVNKDIPTQERTQTIYWMRKDWLDYVK